MKKSILISCFLCFNIFNCLAQLEYGKITYQIILSENKEVLTNNLLKEDYQKAINATSLVDFTLFFNKNESYFRLNNRIDTTIDVESLKLFGLVPGDTYISITNKIKKEHVDDFLGNYIILYDFKEIDWLITNENKLIDGYLCYKATCQYEVKNAKGIFKFPVTAWFNPKVPIPYGPIGYYGLPGLIMELQIRNSLYVIKKLELNLNESQIEKLDKGKTITEQEYIKIVNDFRP